MGRHPIAAGLVHGILATGGKCLYCEYVAVPKLPEITPADMFALLTEKTARVAELERQRAAVLAIVDREPIDARRAYDDIRKIYGGGQ